MTYPNGRARYVEFYRCPYPGPNGTFARIYFKIPEVDQLSPGMICVYRVANSHSKEDALAQICVALALGKGPTFQNVERVY